MTMPAIRFSEHAIDRMLEWGLDVDDVEAALAEGETIEDYADGSRLSLGRAGGATRACRRRRRRAGWGLYCGDRVRA